MITMILGGLWHGAGLDLRHLGRVSRGGPGGGPLKRKRRRCTAWCQIRRTSE